MTDRGEPVQSALSTVQREAQLTWKDRQLLTELCNGVLRTEIRLTFILEQNLKNIKNFPRPFLFILFIALYSLLFLDRIPDYAVLSTSVSQVKKRYGRTLGNVAYAVLNAVLRKKATLQKPDAYLRVEDQKCDQVTHALARFFSIPFWLLNFWRVSYGMTAAINFAQRSFARPRIGIVINAKNRNSNELRSKFFQARSKGCDLECIGKNGFAFDSRTFQGLFSDCDLRSLHEDGLISFQSPSSQAVVAGLALNTWNQPIWDMCAGFGGKSALLSSLGCHIALCTDTSESRLRGLRRDFARRYLSIPIVVFADASVPPLSTFNGNILLDAPCSGLGILSRRPDIRRRLKGKRSLRHFPRQQLALLESAFSVLKIGRELAYITCTLNPEENEELVRSFLTRHPTVKLLREWQTPVHAQGYDGMYGARMIKT